MPLICGLVKLTANFVILDSETVTANVPPVFELMVPSVAFTAAASALYKIIEPVATPAVKVKLVAVPKLVPATVGVVAGLGEANAPEKVKFLEPVYPVTVFPLASWAVDGYTRTCCCWSSCRSEGEGS